MCPRVADAGAAGNPTHPTHAQDECLIAPLLRLLLCPGDPPGMSLEVDDVLMAPDKALATGHLVSTLQMDSCRIPARVTLKPACAAPNERKVKGIGPYDVRHVGVV